MNTQELKDGLRDYYGSEQFFRHMLNRNMVYSEGAQFFMENAGGGTYWFADIVATELMKIHRKEEFIHIHLVAADGKATILADDGNGNPLYKRKIDYTDCPDGDWEFYLENNTFYLPSER